MKQLTVFQNSLFGLGKKHQRIAPVPVVSLEQQRKKQLVEKLYKEHFSNLCGWLQNRYGKSGTDAEETAQKTFTKLLEMDSLDHVENPKAFLYTVAVNFALLDVRSRTTSQKYLDKETQNISENVEEITPERIYSSATRFQRLIESIDKLTEKQKKILYLSRIEGKTYEEIHQQIGWSLADISRQISQAMSVMRDELTSQPMAKDKR